MHVYYIDCHTFMMPWVFLTCCHDILRTIFESIVMSLSPGMRTASVYTVLLPCLTLFVTSSPFTPIGLLSTVGILIYFVHVSSCDVSSVTSSFTDCVTIRPVTITPLTTPSSTILCHRRSVFQQIKHHFALHRSSGLTKLSFISCALSSLLASSSLRCSWTTRLCSLGSYPFHRSRLPSKPNARSGNRCSSGAI